MNRLPALSGKKLLKILLNHGYQALRKKGSHVFVETADGKRGTAIPLHGNEDLGTGLLHSILNDLGIPDEVLQKMLHRKRL